MAPFSVSVPAASMVTLPPAPMVFAVSSVAVLVTDWMETVPVAVIAPPPVTLVCAVMLTFPPATMLAVSLSLMLPLTAVSCHRPGGG